MLIACLRQIARGGPCAGESVPGQWERKRQHQWDIGKENPALAWIAGFITYTRCGLLVGQAVQVRPLMPKYAKQPRQVSLLAGAQSPSSRQRDCAEQPGWQQKRPAIQCRCRRHRLGGAN